MYKSLEQMPKELQKVYVTPREKDIILCLADGLTMKATAERLGIAYPTTCCTLTRALRRLKSNKYDLVYKAHQMGLVGG